MSEDDSVKHEGKWTRDDLPEPSRLSRLKHEIVKDFFWEDILDEIADHLNAHHPKPAHRLLSSAAECVLGAEDRVRSAKGERDEARKAFEDERIVNESMIISLFEVSRQRDKAQDQWKKWEHKANEWKARAEEAEADREKIAEEFADFRVEVVAEAVKYRESHPPISRADIDKALEDRMMEGWNYRSDLVDAVCRLFGIEAEPTVDPVEAKARELWEVGRGMSVRIEFDDIAPDHRGEYLRIARHLIDKEEGDG